MKPNKADFAIIGLLTLIAAIAFYVYQNTPVRAVPMSHERVRYLRDSLEMEYYKSLLDTTFLFNHSEIR